MIMGEIRRYLRDDGMIRVSRSLKETAVQMYRARENLERRLGRDPTLAEIAKVLSVDVEELAMVMEASTDVESLEQVIYRGDGQNLTLMDRLEDGRDRQQEAINRLLVQQLTERLSDQEKHLLYMRYGQEMTQSYIAAKLGISQVQVSRMEKKILQKIRKQQNLTEQA